MNDSAKLQTGVEPIGHAEKVGKTLIYFFTHKNSKSPTQPWLLVGFLCTVFSRPRNETWKLWLGTIKNTDVQRNWSLYQGAWDKVRSCARAYLLIYSSVRRAAPEGTCCLSCPWPRDHSKQE